MIIIFIKHIFVVLKNIFFKPTNFVKKLKEKRKQEGKKMINVYCGKRQNDEWKNYEQSRESPRWTFSRYEFQLII